MLTVQAAFTLLLSLPLVAGTGTIQCTNDIVEFNLIDPAVSPPLFTELTPVVDLSDFSTCKLNIAAEVVSEPSNCDKKFVQCVQFFFDGMPFRKEKFTPYTLYGDILGGAITARQPKRGKHTIKACTYSDKACTKNEMGCKEMEVDFLHCTRAPVAPIAPVTPAPVSRAPRARAPRAPVTRAPVEPTAAPMAIATPSPTDSPVADECSSINEVVGFELVDAESPYQPIVTPFTPPMIDLSDFPTCSLNIFAVVNENTCGDAPVKCVKLSLGSDDRRENFAPYALYGNTGRFIRSGKPDIGAQKLKACTYTDDACREGESGCLEVDVYVKDCISMSM